MRMHRRLPDPANTRRRTTATTLVKIFGPNKVKQKIDVEAIFKSRANGLNHNQVPSGQKPGRLFCSTRELAEFDDIRLPGEFE